MSPIMVTLRCYVIIVMYIIMYIVIVMYIVIIMDRRRSTTKYVSQSSSGKHVRGGVTPQEIQTHASNKDEIMKLVLLEKLQWCLASLGLQKR
jgi:hypothetical protein